MGCNNSKATKTSTAGPSVEERNIKLAIESWTAVKAAFDLQTVGNLFYDTLFEMYPAMPDTLFKGVDKEGQAKKLMEMIDAAVGMLDGKISELVPILKDLGERHCAYGVEDEHYAPVGEALIATLGKGLKEAFTPETKEAWVWVYGVIEKTMKEGASTDKGRQLLAEYKAKQASAMDAHVKNATESWAAVKAAFDLQTVGNLFYDTLFEMYPAMPDTLFKGVDKEGQAKKLMEMIDAAVGMLDGKISELVPILKDLGERHGAYGVEDEHYAPVGEALIATLEKGLKDAFTPEVKEAWVVVYGIIEKTMKEGASTEKGAKLLAEYKAKHAE